jgi:hypothetical protein
MPERARYNVFLDRAQLDGLRQVKERDGVLPAEQIRRAVDRWLAEKGIAIKRPMGRARVNSTRPRSRSKS